MTCIHFIAARFVVKEVERGILPGLEKKPEAQKIIWPRPFLVPFSNVYKRGLATYKTLSQEREEILDAHQAELVRLEDQLFDLWQDLGYI